MPGTRSIACASCSPASSLSTSAASRNRSASIAGGGFQVSVTAPAASAVRSVSARFVVQRMAMALGGEPTPPWTHSGADVSRNS